METITGTPTGTATATGNATAACTPASAVQQAQYNDLVASSHSGFVAIGAGVGIPLGLLFLTFLALFVIEKRKNRQMMQENRAVPSQGEKPMGVMGSWGVGGNPEQPQGWEMRTLEQRSITELGSESRSSNPLGTVKRY